MIEPAHKHLSLTTQCQLLSLSRSGWYYEPKGATPLNLKLMRLIDEQSLLTPYYGSRQMACWFKRQGYTVGRHRVRRLIAPDGVACTIPRPSHEPAPPAASDLSLSLAKSGCHTGKSGVVHRFDLHPDQTRIFVFSGHHGLAKSQSVGLAAFEHDGDAVLCGSAGRRAGAVWRARHLQHGSRRAIYFAGVHCCAERPRDQDFDGWQGPVDGQCVHRTAVAKSEI